MIALEKTEPPDTLLEHQFEWTEEYRRYKAGDPNVPKAAARRYAHPEIKQRLREETRGKCAYCESRFAHVHAGDIEHIRPKNEFPELVVEWTNLTLACRECNRRKCDYYSENRPLLNPYLDEPAHHLEAHGPLLQAKVTSLPGAETEARLELNRAELLLIRRAEKLNDLNRLRRLAAATPDAATQDFYLEELVNAGGDDAEFSMVCRTYVEKAAGELVTPLTQPRKRGQVDL